MRKLFTLYLLLNKRLLKKPTYLAILLLIPLLVALFQIAAQENSGVLSVALASQDPQDTFAAEFIEKLYTDKSLIVFFKETPENAMELVKSGKADAAWIFPENLQACIQAYAEGQKGSGGFIRVVEREQTIPLRLTREKLSGAVYEQTSRILFLQYLRQYAPQTETMNDQQLLAYLDATHVNGELFVFSDIYGNQREKPVDFLTSPLRGMLAIVAVITSVVTAMFYQKDKDKGLLALLPSRYHPIAEFGYQMISSVNVLCSMLVALVVSDLSVGIGRELLLLLLFSPCCSLFGMVLRTVFGGKRGLTILLPILTVAMLVICPMFFDFTPLRFLQYALPATYFINGAYSQIAVLHLLIYLGILLLIYVICKGLRQYFRNGIAKRH